MIPERFAGVRRTPSIRRRSMTRARRATTGERSDDIFPRDLSVAEIQAVVTG